MLLSGRACRGSLLGVAVALALGAVAAPARAQDGPPPPSNEPRPEEPLVRQDEQQDVPAGGEAGHGAFGLRIGFFSQEDGGDGGNGNPFLDEEETVIEPVIIFEHNATDNLTLTGQLSYDYVSSASIDRLSKFPEQSGASGDYYFGGDFGFRYKVSDRTRIASHAGFSVEYDYTSIGLGFDVARDFNEKDTTLKLGLTAYYDIVRVIRFDGSENEGDEDRISLTLNLGGYQVLTPTVHGELGVSFTYQEGFLETAFNAVVIEDPTQPPNPNLSNNARGTEVTEELPDTRLRGAVHGRIRKYFETGTSLELGARVYGDTWGIYSATIEPRLYQWIVQDRLMARVRYRFYVQTASKRLDDHFFVVKSDRTQDSDLGDFSAHSVGLQFVIYFTKSVSVDIAGDYVLRSDDLNQIIVAGGLRIEF